VKILKFFDADPRWKKYESRMKKYGSGMKKKRIREGKYGSGINIPDPQQYGHKTIKNTGSKSHHTVPDAGGAG
jgi:hypothetical protein